MPSRSRRSTKITPPWSRRRWTQPINTTVWPSSAARRAPPVWVRRRSPRKSSETEGSIIVLISGRRQARGNLILSQTLLLAGGHVLEGVTAGGDFVVADDQRETSA